jgi:hypothetical protein
MPVLLKCHTVFVTHLLLHRSVTAPSKKAAHQSAVWVSYLYVRDQIQLKLWSPWSFLSKNRKHKRIHFEFLEYIFSFYSGLIYVSSKYCAHNQATPAIVYLYHTF